MAQQALHRAADGAQPASVRFRWPLIGSLTLLALIGAFGNAWDLYWHIMVGRDSFWIPPHTMMYTAVAIGGLTAAAMVLAHTFGSASGENVTRFLFVRAPLGYIVLGLGALQMVLSAPFDDWYHRRFGLDVTVWSPPHLIGFSGATVMLAGLTIAATSERLRLAALPAKEERRFFWLLALLFALVVRWVTFLNSTTLSLSWVLERDSYAIAGPWAPWWGLWTGLFLGWTFVASVRCLPGARAWRLPLAVVGIALLLRLLEYLVSALGFALVLPWGSQTMDEPFRILFDYDLGLWIMTVVLVLPVGVIAALSRLRPRWPAARFGLVAGASFGLLLAGQFLALRPVFDLAPLGTSRQIEVVVVTLVAGIAGGLIGAFQGDWLARFRR